MYWRVLDFRGHPEVFRSDRTCSEKKKKKGKKTIYPGNESTMDKCGKTLTIDYLGKENRVWFCFDCCHFFCRFAIISKFRS